MSMKIKKCKYTWKIKILAYLIFQASQLVITDALSASVPGYDNNKQCRKQIEFLWLRIMCTDKSVDMSDSSGVTLIIRVINVMKYWLSGTGKTLQGQVGEYHVDALNHGWYCCKIMMPSKWYTAKIIDLGNKIIFGYQMHKKGKNVIVNRG